MTTSLSKMFMVLDLFDEHQACWTADAICERLNLSTSSGYRYIRELSSAGLLARMAKGMYVLGPRIIELEYVMRTSDPVAKVGLPILRQLAQSTGCDVLLSNIYGLHIINVLHVRGVEGLGVTYTRGRQHPLFRGAVAKSILPFLARTQLLKIYEAHPADIAEAGLGDNWLAFWRALQAMKKQGFCESRGELDPGLHGLGVPVMTNGSVIGSVTLVYSSERARLLNVQGLLEQMRQATHQLGEAMQDLDPAEAVAAQLVS
jgi:DNA-binding IclR family transcriptional regulator